MLNKATILGRFPTMKQLAPVFALTFLLCNAWTMYHFFWKLPGWLYYLTVREILSILAYSFSVNLLESVLIVIGLLGLAAILPHRWFRDVFVPVSAAFVPLMFGYMVFFLNQFFFAEVYPSIHAKTFPFVIVGIFFLASWLGRNTFARKVLEAFADRTLVLLYIFLPLGTVSLTAVLIQNLF